MANLDGDKLREYLQSQADTAEKDSEESSGHRLWEAIDKAKMMCALELLEKIEAGDFDCASASADLRDAIYARLIQDDSDAYDPIECCFGLPPETLQHIADIAAAAVVSQQPARAQNTSFPVCAQCGHTRMPEDRYLYASRKRR